jgi:hypothetical protein
VASSEGFTASSGDGAGATPLTPARCDPDELLRAALLDALARLPGPAPIRLTVIIEADLAFALVHDGPGMPATGDGGADQATLIGLLTTESSKDGERGLAEVSAACGRVVAESWHRGRHHRIELNGAAAEGADAGFRLRRGSRLSFWLDPAQLSMPALSGLGSWLRPDRLAELGRHQATLTLRDLRRQ